MEVEALSIAEALRLVSVIAVSMIYIFAGVSSYYLEKRNSIPPMFALIFLLLAWCTLTLGTATSGFGRYFPILLVGAPFLSGYIGPALFIYTKQLTNPHERVSLKWFFWGCFGTTHSILAIILPNGLDPAIQSIIHKKPYVHPILSPIMMVHGLQLISFAVLSTFLITRCYISKSNPDSRQTQFWLLTICWTCLVVLIFTNILPTFKIILTEVEPALITLPIAVVGWLSIKATAEESARGQQNRIKERNIRMDSLGRLARGLAHDLNNVLSTVLGHAEIVKMDTPVDSQAHSHLEQIVSGTQRAAVLIDRLLTYSGKRVLLKKIIDPTSHIQSVFHSVATLQPSHLTMSLDISKELPHIRIDSAELEGAIHNLLQNSVNALQNKKGKITLRAAFEERTDLPEDFIGNNIKDTPTLRIEIEDTGIGMSLEESSRALEPFFSTHSNGKGLGLVNVLTSVESAGGALWFQSEQYIGTRFVLWFPIVDNTISEKGITEQKPLQSLRILLVEDDSEVANVLTQIIKSLGIHVELHTCSEEVMSLIKEQRLKKFDIAILDVRLGKMDGIELGHHVLNEQIASSLLFVSGDEPGRRIQQFHADYVHFLRKPIGFDQLKTTLHKMMSH